MLNIKAGFDTTTYEYYAYAWAYYYGAGLSACKNSYEKTSRGKTN